MSARLAEKMSFLCDRCPGVICIEQYVMNINSLKCPGGSLEVVNCFCYLGDVINSESIVTRMKMSWKKSVTAYVTKV